MAWRVYLDESGDHGLDSYDPVYPIFVLASVLLDEKQADLLEATFAELKIKYFGTTNLVFHEREIRRREGPFLGFPLDLHERFITDLSNAIANLNFKVIAALIDKSRLTKAYGNPLNPYEIALGFVLERVAMEVGAYWGESLPVLIEGRGKKEDRSLLAVFRNFRKGDHPLSAPLGPRAGEVLRAMRLDFQPKKANIAGLQLADLVARPIGIHYLRPKQANKAYRIIESKFRRGRGGKIWGYGLKVFP